MRSLLLPLGLAGTLLAGCMTSDMSQRHLVPIPGPLLAEMTAKDMSPADPILIRIYKKESELEVWKRNASGRYALLKTYPMCRWSGQLGPKRREGDRQAPEGFYTVTPSQMNPNSAYHLSFNLGYPNALEQAQGFTGSALMVHGACTSSGCFAMTDDGIAEIYGLAREAFAGGQRSFQVQAFPFRMTPENMARLRSNPNFAFWQNLKEGYDHFEATRQPPKLAFCDKRYIFNPRDGSGPFESGSACPPFEIAPDVQPLVSQRLGRENTRLAELIAGGTPTMSYAYRDGGMHSSFRKMLTDMGPARMQAMVSGRVEISQPEAALKDPFDAGELSEPAATGSIAIR